jgi:molybdate transport system permease protein
MTASGDIGGIVLLTLKVAGFGIGFGAPLALLLAYVLARFEFRFKALLSAIILLPLVLPPVVTGLILLEIFGPQGSAGRFFALFGFEFGFRWTGAALAAGLVALPLMVRPMRIAFEAVDMELHDAMQMDGAGAWKRFWRLDLPLAAPGIIAGIVLGFAKALGEFGATITFVANIPGETRTLSLAIFTALQSAGAMEQVYLLASASIVLSLIAAFASEALVDRFRAIKPRVRG